MSEFTSRTALLLGEDGVERLSRSRVAVFGLGGVGGHACEALVRAGVGAIDLIDFDTVSESNLNRQIFATRATIGMKKTDAAEQRLLQINPFLIVRKHDLMYLPENAERISLPHYDYVLDCIDNITGKLEIIARAVEAGVPVISAMGAGNKLDPSAFRVTDIEKTDTCPLARVMRRELRRRGIRHLTVVYSSEQPHCDRCDGSRGPVPGSVSFVPSAAGLIMAGKVICDLSSQNLKGVPNHALPCS